MIPPPRTKEYGPQRCLYSHVCYENSEAHQAELVKQFEQDIRIIEERRSWRSDTGNIPLPPLEYLAHESP
ncbi:MAG: hypothetical protein P9X22_06735 [Candidatus Zapsychrus exili]|nr:hypothetical protein [Candidatus Zapsychrus exili]